MAENKLADLSIEFAIKSLIHDCGVIRKNANCIYQHCKGEFQLINAI